MINFDSQPPGPGPRGNQRVYQVSELNRNIKALLEDKFPFIWISGEISNFRRPSSGHCYFSLSDQAGQISAVMFRVQAGALKFRPEDGMTIVGLGRVSVYEPRGTYQIILEFMQPQGVGALQIAFEQLKEKLAKEGLFDDHHKRPLPLLPKKISVVTSPTGAAVRDFINVAGRRFPNLPIEVVPAAVQGVRAPAEIRRAILFLNKLKNTDIIVLSRGGGSIEDLCAFNDEKLARAIFASRIPVVSAVGHETDFTIADFVADLRAPTPSAAAEITVPARSELEKQLSFLKQKLYQNTFNRLLINKKQVGMLTARIIHPKRRLQDLRLRLDDNSARLARLIDQRIKRECERLEHLQRMFMQASPVKTMAHQKQRLLELKRDLIGQMASMIRQRQSMAARHADMLEALNPMSVLKRGYSITRKLPQKSIVRSYRRIKIGQPLEIVLSSGRLTVSVDEKQPPPE